MIEIVVNGEKRQLSIVEVQQAVNELNRNGQLVLTCPALPMMEGKLNKCDAVIGNVGVLHLDISFKKNG